MNRSRPLFFSLKMKLSLFDVSFFSTSPPFRLSFSDEEELRKYGYPKTPDVKLTVPFMLDGVMVHWIESKVTLLRFYSHSH
tara:strand:- start:131 stop:373 length:243 start_codon:yes stop_codon:yes gene_type:complete